MMLGPYFQDRPAYYACLIDFCLKYNPRVNELIGEAAATFDNRERQTIYREVF